MWHFCHHDTIISLVGNWIQHRRGRTFELSGPRGCRTMTSRGALASSRVMLFNRFTRRSGRGVTTGLGPSLWRQKTCQHTNDPNISGSSTFCRLLSFLPDSAYVAGTTFSCALIEDDRELHLIPSLELQAVLHFFYMEEQLLALTNFIRDKAKLGANSK